MHPAGQLPESAKLVGQSTAESSVLLVHDSSAASASRPFVGGDTPVQSFGVHDTDIDTTPASHEGCVPASE